MTRIRDWRVCSIAFALVACLFADPSNAQSVEAEASDSENFNEALDELSIDVAHSIGDAIERRGLSFDGDLRIGDIFVGDDIDNVRLGEAEAIWRGGSDSGALANPVDMGNN